MRLIDADALEYDTEWSEYHDGFTAYSQMEIDTAPTIDAVSVVRCKECRYWHSGECWGIPYRGDYDTSIDTKADDYCSYGERSDT